jgi:hypothetical protein
MGNLELLSEVALLRDLPERGLVRGQVGTVVETLAEGAVEVEFCDDKGRTYATAALLHEDLVRLHHGPLEQVARAFAILTTTAGPSTSYAALRSLRMTRS